MVGAALSGFLGFKFGFPAVFWLAAAFAVVTIVAVLRIPATAIDNRVARGLSESDTGERARGFRILIESQPLLALAAALVLFLLGNAAMLPCTEPACKAWPCPVWSPASSTAPDASMSASAP
jgi:predicted MFS family arabinose efflux permease